MRRRHINVIVLLYVIAGLVIAWNRGYINLGLLKAVFSALLAVLLWWLPLLGVNLHIR